MQNSNCQNPCLVWKYSALHLTFYSEASKILFLIPNDKIMVWTKFKAFADDKS